MNGTLNKFPSPDRRREQVVDDENKKNNTEQTPEEDEQKTEQQQDLGETSEEPAIDHEEIREKNNAAIESAQQNLEDAFGNDPEQRTETDEETPEEIDETSEITNEMTEEVDERANETVEEETEEINETGKEASEEIIEENLNKDLENLEVDIETMSPEAQEYLKDLERQQEAEFKGLNAEEVMSGELGPEKPKKTRLKKVMMAITAGAMLWMSSGILPETIEARSSNYGTERVIKKEAERLQNLPAKELKHFKKSLKRQTNRVFKTFLDSLF